MANENHVKFLGRVPIDTALIQLLDATSKGELPGADAKSSTSTPNGTSSQMNGRTNGINGSHQANGHSQDSFPLLERYLATTSAKVWKGICGGVLAGLASQREDNTLALQARNI